MREQLYSTFVEGDFEILNPTSIDWSSFEWTNGYYVHTVTSQEIMRPYLISSTYYGSVDYWDIILLVNNIENAFEIVPETEIYIPKLNDIKTFILKHKMAK